MKKIAWIAVIVVTIGIIFMRFGMGNQEYSATDILENANFNLDNQFLNVHSIDVERENIFEEVEIPLERQHDLIKIFKNAKFIPAESTADHDYRINITLNTGYAMFLDSKRSSLYVISSEKNYEMKGGEEFFAILNNAEK
ncbi:hypothetical protein NSQ95_12720 [Psychrobacillus sp. FSL W7-1457]|uniref:hypothetical protein n=1 Tax=unclassified Psychrobacillus TaxID=2636677 RepID=UPI0030F819CC